MKKTIFWITIAIILFAVCGGNVTKAQTLHAIIVANIDDPSIGSSCLNDKVNMEIEMQTIASANNYSLEKHIIDGDDFSYSNVEKTLQRLRCASYDIVFFYYTGHGGRAVNDKTRYPQMSLGHYDSEQMPLHKVDKIIAEKNPKFRIIMADCCNSIDPGMTPKELILSEETIIKGNVSQNYRNLFANQSGNVIVCSSSEGEPSKALVDGGAFTLSFLKELGNMVNGNGKVNWSTLMENTRNTTFRRANHTPLYEVNPGSSNTPINPLPYTGVPTVNDDFLSALMQLTSQNTNKMDRINRVQPLISNYFSSPNARVEVYGRSFNTMLSRESSTDFLARVATSHNLASFVVLSAEKDGNGKITYLKLHEIYKEN